MCVAFAVLALAGCSAGPNDPNRPIAEADFAGRIKVACVGDSITQGSGTSAPGGSSNAYPAQLQRMLGDRYEVQNFGVGGTTLLNKGDKPYQREVAFTQAKAFVPDVVVIMLGTNDTKPQNWVHMDEFVADYKNLVEQFTALPGKPRLFLCLPCVSVGAGNFGITETNITRELPVISGLSKELGLGLIDNHSATQGRDELFPDRVHPNNEGANLLAATVYRALRGRPYVGPSVIVPMVAPVRP